LYPSMRVKFLSLYAFGIRELLGAIIRHLKPRKPKSQNPEVLIPHLFTFENSGMVELCC